MTLLHDDRTTTAPGRHPRPSFSTFAVILLLLATLVLAAQPMPVSADDSTTGDLLGNRGRDRSPLPAEPEWFVDESSLPFEPLSITDVAATQHWGCSEGPPAETAAISWSNWTRTGQRPDGCRFTENRSTGHLLATPCPTVAPVVTP